MGKESCIQTSQDQRWQFGFTLLELVLVIAIITTLGALSSVFYTGFLSQNAVANTQNQLLGSIRKAQFYSMIGKGNSTWGIHYGSGTITLFKGTTYSSRDPSYDETFSYNTTTAITGGNDITFNRLSGSIASATAITISSNTSTKQILINSEGVASRQ